MTEGTKTADRILAGVVKAKNDQISYDNLRKEFSDSFHTVLVEILTKSPQDSETVTHLIMDRKHELSSGISHSPFPKWLRQIAYSINNPDGIYSTKLVETVHELCSYICLEYHKSTPEEQPTIQYLQQDQRIGFISEAASVFAKRIQVAVN